jgi:hypothetical protein
MLRKPNVPVEKAKYKETMITANMAVEIKSSMRVKPFLDIIS